MTRIRDGRPEFDSR